MMSLDDDDDDDDPKQRAPALFPGSCVFICGHGGRVVGVSAGR